MTRFACVSLAYAALLVVAAPAAADVRLGWLSQQVGPGRASIGASIQVSSRAPAHAPSPARRGSPGHRTSAPPPAIPTLSSSSSLARNPRPAGPSSFWYTTLNGQRCIYLPRAVTPCFNVVTPTPARPAQPPVKPAAIAASVAKRLPLTPGRIEASPSARMAGLTGAASWFWLEGAPASRSLSASLRGERVTVNATARDVDWSFGDGASVRAGPGVPYRRGDPPPRAVTHRYQTRCLPGDQGRDPYVVASCGQDGYRVSASVAWGISFQATGAVSTSGSLPSRSTATSIAYPVSEARGFLAGGLAK